MLFSDLLHVFQLHVKLFPRLISDKPLHLLLELPSPLDNLKIHELLLQRYFGHVLESLAVFLLTDQVEIFSADRKGASLLGNAPHGVDAKGKIIRSLFQAMKRPFTNNGYLDLVDISGSIFLLEINDRVHESLILLYFLVLMLGLRQKFLKIELVFWVMGAYVLNILRKDKFTLKNEVKVSHGLPFSHDRGPPNKIILNKVVLILEQGYSRQIFEKRDLP